MNEKVILWDRETALMFMSMIVASYAWIATERLLIGIAVGIAMETILVSIYQSFAYKFGWQNLTFVDFLQEKFVPILIRLFSKTQSA